jgi:flagellar biosynthetic protein FliQ
VLLLAGPLLFAALIVGLVVAILQATTSIQEQTLTFVPKIIAILLVLAFLGGWMFSSLRDYTVQLFMTISDIAR